MQPATVMHTQKVIITTITILRHVSIVRTRKVQLHYCSVS